MPLQISALQKQRPVQPILVPALPPAATRPAARPTALVPALGRPGAMVGDELFALGAETVTMARDEVLFYEGDGARTVYRVVEGMVRISILLPDGRRHLVDFLQAGDIVGLTAGDAHTHTAEAVIPTILSRMPRSRLETAMEQRPALTRKLYAIMQADLVAAHERLLLLGRKSVTERLASLLLVLRERQPADTGAPRLVHLPMGRTDIADYLGLTIETVSRTFTKLRSAGLIRLNDTYTVEILDPERLADLAAAR